jgi:hypothetical protein
MFNEGSFWHRAQSGGLAVTVLKSKHPCPPEANQPFCTSSQLVSYRDGALEVARLHQYLRPDGTLGGSGRPDPKYLLYEGVLYVQLGKRAPASGGV